jgi:peptide/nickel transport system ATP-binding protein
MKDLLSVHDLELDYVTPRGIVRALDGATLKVGRAVTLGIVGESGSGKTTLGMAVGKLLPTNLRRAKGELLFEGRSVLDLEEAALRALRRNDLGFVFQNPMTALDPTMRIMRQVSRALGAAASGRGVRDLLAKVGLPDVERVARSYPHQLSGGMAQRVAIAIAIARNPRLLIADEPTASLDASLRDQILSLLVSLRELYGTSIVLLSHELRVVGRYCDDVAVMYGGRVVEYGRSAAVFGRPAHPYTRALLAAAPGKERPGDVLEPIRGAPPVLTGRAPNCAFSPRCQWALERCRAERPETRAVDARDVVCHRSEEVLAAETRAPEREPATL